MYRNRALIESADIRRYPMTDRDRRVKKALCQLLIDKGHRKYAERFWKLDFNIIPSAKYPDFTAAISFDEATVFLSDGFLGSGPAIFNQLDVLLRHEMAHNLMMHQIRMMYVFKKLHADDPEEAYAHIKVSMSLHKLLNYLEDFEISNKRYSSEDKKIVRMMQLNGRVIGGLVTEDHRGSWAKMSLEDMYNELTKELIQINAEIRSDPNWRPLKTGSYYEVDSVKALGKKAMDLYRNTTSPSPIKCPIDYFMKQPAFKKQFAEIYQKLIATIYTKLEAERDQVTEQAFTQHCLDLVQQIAVTTPTEAFKVTGPATKGVLVTLYSPEDKAVACMVLKNLGGNINYNPTKFIVKGKTNSQDYRDAWNLIMKTLDKGKFSNKVLSTLADRIAAGGGVVGQTTTEEEDDED